MVTELRAVMELALNTNLEKWSMRVPSMPALLSYGKSPLLLSNY
jgi:hypothetical protein